MGWNLFKFVDELAHRGISFVSAAKGKEANVLLGGARIVTVEHELPDLTAGASIVGAFPAGVIPLGATLLVTEAITLDGGGATVEFGIDGGDTDAFLAATALATLIADFETDQADFTANPTSLWNAAAQDLVLTPDAGAFTAGAAKVLVTYLELPAPAE